MKQKEKLHQSRVWIKHEDFLKLKKNAVNIQKFVQNLFDNAIKERFGVMRDENKQ